MILNAYESKFLLKKQKMGYWWDSFIEAQIKLKKRMSNSLSISVICKKGEK